MEDMANATENWFQNGGKIAEFQKVSDCSAVRGWQYIYRFQPAESAVWPVKLNNLKKSTRMLMLEIFTIEQQKV